MNKLGCCLLAVAAFACSKKDSSGGGECGDAVNKAMDAVNETRKTELAEKSSGSDMTPEKKERLEKNAERAGKMVEQIRPILIKHCTEDNWSPEAIACIAKVTDRKGIQSCVQTLPKEQGEKVSQEIMGAMMNGMRQRGMGGPPGMGGAPHDMQPFQHPPMGSAVPTGSGAAPSGSAGSAAPAPAPAGSATGSATK